MATTKTAVKKGFTLFDGQLHGGILSGMVDRYNGIQIATDNVDPSMNPEDFKD